MERVRCVIADMPHKLLADIIENMVEKCDDIEVVERVDNHADLISAVTERSAEVIILGVKSRDLPEVYTKIAKCVANILVIGLVDDGRCLSVFLDNAGQRDITRVILALRRSAAEQMQ